MKTARLALLASAAAILVAAPLHAQDKREMEAHEHGVSTLELAVEGGEVAINLTSPGADIVGFEYAASSDADKDAVEAAIRVLLTPENVVTLPDAAECRLTEVLAHLHGGGDHDEDEHGHGDHEDHADDHADEAHHDDGHGDDHGDEHGDDHEAGAEHSEFHVRYRFACEHPEDLTALAFPFFERFGAAKEIEAQYVTDAGAGSAEITRDAAELSLK
ncbi:Protein of unknown function [Albimonas donghaensis]|uniref:DUF2796 domain-containing protein n=1 Tax=Albimonas donghaensis TaxID=356660 RepID=A0A1H2QIP0_9RHOB|nr:DUF2796 domain-containing protein [Albimonas donghaensis]SDW07006.1 Protein of unknown function [Albimonas donghaensis]